MSEKEAKEFIGLRERLRWKSWRRTSYSGAVLLIVGLLSLPLLLITRDIVFEIVFLITIPAGILLMFRSVEPQVRAGTANAVIMSTLLDLKALSEVLTTCEQLLFVPVNDGGTGVQVYLGGPSSEAYLALPGLAEPLTRIYELEMGDLSKLELQYVCRNLPKVIVDGLQLAESIMIEAGGDEVRMTVRRPVFWPIYLDERLASLYERVGCPLAWSVGESIAKSSGRTVRYMGYECSKKERWLRYRYSLGPVVRASSTPG
ncbi:MAG: hypothetical protein JTT13_10680 [Candidatus Brockarchaeota archaeon]|nr:hypothetical protein [Candidatus Brockarchaeota archaeon]